MFMKKIYLLILSACLSFSLYAQTVSIVANPGTSGNIVVGQNNYHVSESIYLDAEIGSGNFITAGSSIQEVNLICSGVGTGTTINNFRIYMRNVPGATSTFTNGIYSTAGYTLVYDGPMDASTVGLVGVTLTTPFVRTPGSNLAVLIERLDNFAHTAFVFDASVGNITDFALPTSRRYNSNTLPVSGVTSLTATNFRPAIQFVRTFNVDAEVLGILAPNASCFSTPQLFSVVVFNAGLNPIPANAATVTLKIGGPNTYSGTRNNAGVIAPGAFELVDFNNVNVNNAGINIDTAYVSLPGDGTTYNDTIVGGSFTATTLSSFPVNEDAETTSGSFPVFNYVDVVVDDQLWTIQTGSYQNADMPAPLVPRAPGNQFYLFDSYSGANSTGVISRLFSNCISIPTNNSALLSFYMSHDNVFPLNLDSLYVSVSTDNAVTWTRVGPGWRRADLAAATPIWSLKTVDISAYAGQTIQIGFEGVSEYGNAIGLDDISITVNSLPVTLLNFDAQRNGSVNLLKWATSQELNSSRFLVERSSDGRNFTEIGVVNAAGFSNDRRDYRFTDASPVKGINYYRLRMVDIDDTYKYSEVKNVRNLGMSEISFAPNPVQDFIRLSIDAEKSEKATVRITDMSGKLVQTSALSVVNGSNQFTLNSSTLAKGTYILTVQLSEGSLVKKFTKL
ncbi:MAG TPA: hypothetical protein DHV17_05565 [Chitinophagaceae bacterium]|nr:hypothetical protein [Chitinophagaceae bacterium]